MPPFLAERQPGPRHGGWLASAVAVDLQRQELHQSIPRMTAVYGRVGLYLCGVDAAPRELSGNMQQQVLRLHRLGEAWGGDLQCLDAELPLARESVELVYLMHALEACARPEGLLHEIERVLAPEGQVLVIGLNPWSPWRWRWAGADLHARSDRRLRALLRDAGFEVVAQQGVGPRLPWSVPRPDQVDRRRRDVCDFLCAGYLLQARKRRAGMTPLPTRAVALQAGMHPG